MQMEHWGCDHHGQELIQWQARERVQVHAQVYGISVALGRVAEVQLLQCLSIVRAGPLSRLFYAQQ